MQLEATGPWCLVMTATRHAHGGGFSEALRPTNTNEQEQRPERPRPRPAPTGPGALGTQPRPALHGAVQVVLERVACPQGHTPARLHGPSAPVRCGRQGPRGLQPTRRLRPRQGKCVTLEQRPPGLGDAGDVPAAVARRRADVCTPHTAGGRCARAGGARAATTTAPCIQGPGGEWGRIWA